VSSFMLHGAGVGGGIAIGQAHLISSARLEVAHYEIAAADVEQEVMRFNVAVEKVRAELLALRRSVPASAPAELGAFLNLHLMILDDSTLSQAPRELVRTRRCNAEWALVMQMDGLVAQFEEIEDAYLRERKADIIQVVERVLKDGSHTVVVTPEGQEAIEKLTIARRQSLTEVLEGWDPEDHPEVVEMIRHLAHALLADDDRLLADAQPTPTV